MEVQKKRKADNLKNIRAYQHMIDFIHTRAYQKIKVLPGSKEIQILEVFKKLTESGWIVQKAEVKQIINFVGITVEDVKNNPDMTEFLNTWLKALGISQQMDYFLGCDPSDLINDSLN